MSTGEKTGCNEGTVNRGQANNHSDLTPENLRIATRVMRALASEVFEDFQRCSLLYQFLHKCPSTILHGIASALEDRSKVAACANEKGDNP